MSFRQDIPGFGEPAEGSWDGWARINTDRKNGGIVGIFRQAARETSRTVSIKKLSPQKRYIILSAPDGKKITEMTGSQLDLQGFKVNLEKIFDGAIFEIRSIE
jgi:alpha-galactosidase